MFYSSVHKTFYAITRFVIQRRRQMVAVVNNNVLITYDSLKRKKLPFARLLLHLNVCVTNNHNIREG